MCGRTANEQLTSSALEFYRECSSRRWRRHSLYDIRDMWCASLGFSAFLPFSHGELYTGIYCENIRNGNKGHGNAAFPSGYMWAESVDRQLLRVRQSAITNVFHLLPGWQVKLIKISVRRLGKARKNMAFVCRWFARRANSRVFPTQINYTRDRQQPRWRWLSTFSFWNCVKRKVAETGSFGRKVRVLPERRQDACQKEVAVSVPNSESQGLKLPWVDNFSDRIAHPKVKAAHKHICLITQQRRWNTPRPKCQ